MKKLRLALNKGEELRFLSHLDYAQAVERIIRRAKIKMAYSQGFNPHMKISFSSALSLGITASAEYLDMEMEEDLSVEEVIERMNNVAPKGLEILGGVEVEKGVKKMMAACNYAEYIVEGNVTEDVDWEETLKSFNEAETIPYEKITPKKTKMIDMKEFIRKPLYAEVNNGRVKIHMAIGIFPNKGTVKASEVWLFGKEAFNWPVKEDYSIHRKSIMIESEDKIITPLEV